MNNQDIMTKASKLIGRKLTKGEAIQVTRLGHQYGNQKVYDCMSYFEITSKNFIASLRDAVVNYVKEFDKPMELGDVINALKKNPK